MTEHDPTAEQLIEHAARDLYRASVRNPQFWNFTRHVQAGNTEYTLRLTVVQDDSARQRMRDAGLDGVDSGEDVT